MPVYDPPMHAGLLKCMQPKRVAHELSEGVLPFKVAAGDREPSHIAKSRPKTRGEHTQTNGDPSRVHIADLVPYEVLRSIIVNLFTKQDRH